MSKKKNVNYTLLRQTSDFGWIVATLIREIDAMPQSDRCAKYEQTLY